MRATTSVPPPGGYGTIKRTGFMGQSSAPAATAMSSPASKTNTFVISSPLSAARSAQLEFRPESGMDTGVLRLRLSEDVARFPEIASARGGLDFVAVTAENLGADVGTARF